MKGVLRKRYEGSYSIILDFGYHEVVDPQTGQPVLDPRTGKPKRQRKQKWVTFRGSRRDAEIKLNELVRDVHRGEFVETTKLTFGQWLAKWLDEEVKHTCRASTYRGYKAIVSKHLMPALGGLRLQGMTPHDVTQYYRDRAAVLSRATLDVHHAILSSALGYAVEQGVASRNVASTAKGRPKAKESREDAKRHCWTPQEARAALDAAESLGPQLSALLALALDTGMRKGELCGLLWTDVNLETGTVLVDRTLLAAGREPKFGPTKTGNARTVDLNPETVRRLAEHRRTQAQLKMRNRTSYHDLGLVFAKEWGDVHGREDSLGLPLGMNNLGAREFARIVKQAGVRRIKFHGLRHTCATLLLAAGIAPHVVAARLGHSKVTTTLETYAHALPGHGQQAARTLGGLLYGGGW